MKPKRKTGWGCGRCPSIYGDKRMAEACCKCRQCGGDSPYIGRQGSLCNQCGAALELKNAREHLAFAQERLRRAEADPNGVAR